MAPPVERGERLGGERVVGLGDGAVQGRADDVVGRERAGGGEEAVDVGGVMGGGEVDALGQRGVAGFVQGGGAPDGGGVGAPDAVRRRRRGLTVSGFTARPP